MAAVLAARLVVPAGHDRGDGGHLHRRAAASPAGGDHGRQVAGVGAFVKVTVSEVAVAAVTVPGRAVVERDRVVAGGRAEAEAVDRDLRGARQ